MRRWLFSGFAVLTLCLIAGAARAQFPAFLQKGLVVSVAGQIETDDNGNPPQTTPFTATITVTSVSGNTVSGTVTSTPPGVFTNATTWTCVANQYCAALSNRVTSAGATGSGASGQFWLNPANPTGSIFGPDGETYTAVSSCSAGDSCLSYTNPPSGTCTVTDIKQTITAISLAYASSVGKVGSYAYCQGVDNSATTNEPSTTLTSYTFSYPPDTLTISNSGNGTVTSSPAGINCGSACSASFADGSTVTLTATPASGFNFAGWSGAGCSGTGACSVMMNTAQNVSASFVSATVPSFALTVSTSGSGTVTSSPAGINCGSTCSAIYQNGTVVSLTQTAATGSAFAGWGGTCSGVGTCIVTMSAAQSVSASFAAGSAAASPLVAAVLPASRSALVGGTVTAFATMINAGSAAAPGCAIAPIGGAPLNFTYQTTNPATNGLAGTANTPVNIPGNGVQTFVIAVTPTAAFAPIQLPFSFACTNVASAPDFTGLNTLLVSASTTPVPDIVALAGTASNDGVLHIPGASGANAFVVATVNVGASGAITATANTGSATLPLTISLCETNPATGACITPVGSSAALTINMSDTPTFAIFGQATGAIPFDPANSRIFVQFTDSANAVRGETSVAVRTQ